MYILNVMINKKYQKSIRDKEYSYKNQFIYEKISERITDSIDLINYKFRNVLGLGINEDLIYNYLLKKFNSNILRCDISNRKFTKIKLQNYFEFDIDNWEKNENSFDLIYSNFYLHLTNNFELLLKNIYNSLNSDGFLIFTLPGASNFFQITDTMIQTDIDLYSGAYKRKNPSIDINEILIILKKLNFKIPVINSEKIQFEYKNFNKLLQDLRSMSMSYLYDDKKTIFEKKEFLNRLKENYKKNYFYKNNYKLDCEVITVSCWK